MFSGPGRDRRAAEDARPASAPWCFPAKAAPSAPASTWAISGAWPRARAAAAAGGSATSTPARHGIANRAQYAVLGVARDARAGDRRGARRRLRRRLPARAGRGHALRRPGRAAGGPGDQMGPGAGHGRHHADAPPGARGRGAGADLHRPHLLRRGGPGHGLRHPRLRRSARRGAGDGPRDRRQEPARHPRRQAPAQRRRWSPTRRPACSQETVRADRPDRQRPTRSRR